eukprot:GGOE01056601.1.p1 GENE.GGOE01056601.1~~GGOE01056601.1.p1  ORF type:complete len:499 (+),score=98.10 GGOE01056601.1:226-1722(+)
MDSGQEDVLVDVVIIGNGPSGLALSSVLAGHLPFFLAGTHPDELLERRVARMLQEAGSSGDDRELSLVDLDLKAMSEGLQGRSSNPVALLVDTLMHPGADGAFGPVFSFGQRTAVDFRHLPGRCIRHVVLSGGPAGGSWVVMPGDFPTLSPAYWMEMPGWPLRQYCRQKGLEVDVSCRVTRKFISQYYKDYAGCFLKPYLQSVQVTHVERCTLSCTEDTSPKARWTVRGVRLPCNTPVTYHARHVVLACGMYAKPRYLGIEGERDNPLIAHRPFLHPPSKVGNTMLVVGAGMSASDCIVHAMGNRWKVVHVFRSEPLRTSVCEKFAHSSCDYPEYFHLCQLMQGLASSPLYDGHASSELLGVDADGRCRIRRQDSGQESVVQASAVAILIGSTPDLQFLSPELQALIGNGTEPVVKPTMVTTPPTHPVYVDVDPWTLQCLQRDGPPGQRSAVPGLYATGPLRGDNFVRFLVGDSWAVASHVTRTDGLVAGPRRSGDAC